MSGISSPSSHSLAPLSICFSRSVHILVFLSICISASSTAPFPRVYALSDPAQQIKAFQLEGLALSNLLFSLVLLRPPVVVTCL